MTAPLRIVQSDEDQPPYLVLSQAENARIKNETLIIYHILLSTVARVIANKDYAHFGFTPEIIARIERSWEALEPLLLGRLDIHYEPGQPLKAYEINVLHAGGMELRLLDDFTHKVPDGCRYDVGFYEMLRASWLSVFKYAKAHGREIVYYGLDDDSDVKSVIHCKPDGIVISRKAPEVFTPDDPFGINHYLEYDPEKTLVVPPIWSLLMENKAIWAHAWALYPDHPNLMATFFEPEPFLQKGSPYVRDWLNRCQAKAVFSAQGADQYTLSHVNASRILSTLNGKHVFAEYMPEYDIEDVGELALFGFVTDSSTLPMYDFPLQESRWNIDNEPTQTHLSANTQSVHPSARKARQLKPNKDPS